MSLAYRVFGVPRTFDEFADRAKREACAVNVAVEVGDVHEGPMSSYEGNVVLRTSSFFLELEGHTYVRVGSLFGAVEGKTGVDHACLKEAVEKADRLKDLGLKVTVSGKPLASAREALAECTRYLEEIRQRITSL